MPGVLRLVSTIRDFMTTEVCRASLTGGRGQCRRALAAPPQRGGGFVVGGRGSELGGGGVPGGGGT